MLLLWSVRPNRDNSWPSPGPTCHFATGAWACAAPRRMPPQPVSPLWPMRFAPSGCAKPRPATICCNNSQILRASSVASRRSEGLPAVALCNHGLTCRHGVSCSRNVSFRLRFGSIEAFGYAGKPSYYKVLIHVPAMELRTQAAGMLVQARFPETIPRTECLREQEQDVRSENPLREGAPILQQQASVLVRPRRPPLVTGTNAGLQE